MPFIVNPVDDEIDISSADISDYFGDEYRNQLQSIVQKHANLFRPGLGTFNNNIKMPIPFRDETDITGLKQHSFNFS